MAFCKNCGTQVEDGVKFCSGCGAAMETSPTASPEEKDGFVHKIKSINDTPDSSSAFDAKDVADNKGMTVLSYLGPLVFVPMFARKNSKFARFHANQGLVLLITYGAYGIVQAILGAILRAIFPWNWDYGLFGGRGFVYDALTTILSLVWILFSVLAVIGIINTAKGKAKELPFIGKFKILK